MMRPSLCIAASRMFGTPLHDALRTAVAIEILHNALLIHDDIEDGSEQRRGRPTLHRLHGVPLALNAGDMLTLSALRPLLDNRGTVGDRLAFKIFEETEQMARECAEGQAIELGWRRDNAMGISDADYLEMVLKKTCWLGTIYPMRVGALIGSRGEADLDRFTRFGFFLGAAFQIQDDLLNLIADEHYGKELDGDLFEGKRTLLLIHALRECDGAERTALSEMLSRPREQRSRRQVRWLRSLIDRYGCSDYARRVAHEMAGAAVHEFSLLANDLPESRDKEFFAQISNWVVERNA